MREKERSCPLIKEDVSNGLVLDYPDNFTTTYLVTMERKGVRDKVGICLQVAKLSTYTTSVAIPPFPTTTILLAFSNFF